MYESFLFLNRVPVTLELAPELEGIINFVGLFLEFLCCSNLSPNWNNFVSSTEFSMDETTILEYGFYAEESSSLKKAQSP